MKYINNWNEFNEGLFTKKSNKPKVAHFSEDYRKYFSNEQKWTSKEIDTIKSVFKPYAEDVSSITPIEMNLVDPENMEMNIAHTDSGYIIGFSYFVSTHDCIYIRKQINNISELKSVVDEFVKNYKVEKSKRPVVKKRFF